VCESLTTKHRDEAEKILERLRAFLSPRTVVATLSLAQRQMDQIDGAGSEGRQISDSSDEANHRADIGCEQR
jgi:ABC-type sugar transport system ATPase subunit